MTDLLPGHRHKMQRIVHLDEIAQERPRWRLKNRYYYGDLDAFFVANILPGKSVLEIGCGSGELIASLPAKRALGLDLSEAMIGVAKKQFPPEKYPHVKFQNGDAEQLPLEEKFDYVILSDVIGDLTDVWQAFGQLKKVTSEDSRIIITYFNHLWEPVLKLGEKLGMKIPQPQQNWLSLENIENLLHLNGFAVVRKGRRQLIPKYIPFISNFVNRYIARLPLINKLCLVVYLIARPLPQTKRDYSVSVIVPCRNERENIRGAVERIPDMGKHTEIVFVDGNSNDGTVEEIEKYMAEYKDRKDIKLIHQVPPNSKDGQGHGKMLKLGKGDAVRKGFAAAECEMLMILDSDLTVIPEDLPKFYAALSHGHGEFINGSRLVYPMEKDAMRSLNKIANKFFGLLFTWIVEQTLSDTLCGTKVLLKSDYQKILAGRHYFGDFDPFGDFDLLFGAARQNLKIAEIPVRYQERTYGEIKISRFRHGLILLRMSIIGMLKLKLC